MVKNQSAKRSKRDKMEESPKKSKKENKIVLNLKSKTDDDDKKSLLIDAGKRSQEHNESESSKEKKHKVNDGASDLPKRVQERVQKLMKDYILFDDNKVHLIC